MWPDEILLHIFHFLEPRTIVCVIPLVCKKWYRISKDKSLLFASLALLYLHTDYIKIRSKIIADNIDRSLLLKKMHQLDRCLLSYKIVNCFKMIDTKWDFREQWFEGFPYFSEVLLEIQCYSQCKDICIKIRTENEMRKCHRNDKVQYYFLGLSRSGDSISLFRFLKMFKIEELVWRVRKRKSYLSSEMINFR